ncbi:MAG: hypothetical protein ABFD25_00505 [Clostridiaceae bacterium]
MQMKARKKHIFICLLLCSLFLTTYLGVLNANGIISSATNELSSSFGSGGVGQFSIDGGKNFGHFDYMPTTGTSIEFLNYSIKNTRSQFTNTFSDILTAFISAQVVCLFCSSRLSRNICTQFNSLRIVYFLHKKDGMK